MSLYSTAKLSHYSVDGSGRDSYININNGGIYRRFKPHNSQFFDFGSYKAKHISRKIAPEITSRQVWYRNDGSGRDTYAMKQQFLKPRRKNYLNSLRSYDGNPERSLSFEKSLSTQQSTSVKRLSSPRRYEDPYQKLKRSFRVTLDKSWRKQSK